MICGTFCTCTLFYCAVVIVGGLLRSGIDQRVGVVAAGVLGGVVPGVGVLGVTVLVDPVMSSLSRCASVAVSALASVWVFVLVCAVLRVLLDSSPLRAGAGSLKGRWM